MSNRADLVRQKHSSREIMGPMPRTTLGRPPTSENAGVARQVEDVGVTQSPASKTRKVKIVRGGRRASSCNEKRYRADGQGAESSGGVSFGGGPTKRHCQAKGAVSRATTTSSKGAATVRVARVKPLARQFLTMMLRSLTVREAKRVAAKKVNSRCCSVCSSIVVCWASSDKSRGFWLPYNGL